MSGVSTLLEQAGGGILIAGLGAAGTWLGARLLGKAAFKKATDEGWAALTASLQKERNDFQAERKELNQIVHDLREEIQIERKAAAAEHAALRSQISGLTQTIISLENVLRENGLPIPPRVYVAAAEPLVVQATIR